MFEITIKETRVEKINVGGTWGKIGEEIFSERPDMKRDTMGYLPVSEQERPVTRKIFKQAVESLDLAAVIKAINKL